MLNVDKVFVLHVKKGYEDREMFIIDQFEKFGIDFEFILDGDISDLTDEIKNKYFNADMPEFEPAISCTLKHFYALEKIVENNYRNALIFEDDVVLDSNFEDVFNHCMTEVEKIDDDICIYYGNGCNMYVPSRRIRENVYLYEADKSRAADSYSISQTVARKRLDYIKKHKCSFIGDDFFNQVDPLIGVKFYWCHPTIVEQGSMNGLFDSTIMSNRKKSLYRRVKWNADKFYKKNILSFFRK